MEETLPAHHYSSYIAGWILSFNLGGTIASGLGGILPPDTDTEALRETNLWLVL